MKIIPWPDFKGYREIDLNLSRVLLLLERLNNPHLNIPPTIHIAGTNGKGSTISFLKSIFLDAKLKVHCYTSPHLVYFNERIVLDGKEISDKFLEEVLIECKKASEIEPKIPVTFFEGITVAAFLAFSRVKADILLLETGMGGRLDATNILENVLCSVITPISMDHMDFLGNSIEKIATEKAGIIKKNSMVAIGKQAKSVREILIKKSIEMNCKIINYKKFLPFVKNQNISLIGKHQIYNASLAVSVVLSQNIFPITKKNIVNGLQNAYWPARLQKINSGKFFNIIPKNFQLYVDGSHNIEGAETVRSFLDSQLEKNIFIKFYKKFFHKSSQKSEKIFIIFSMLKDKDCVGFIKSIADLTTEIAIISSSDDKFREQENIKKITDYFNIKSFFVDGFEEAIKKFVSIYNKEKSTILVTGSLYLAGRFLEENK